MGCYAGIDIGAVSATAALVVDDAAVAVAMRDGGFSPLRGGKIDGRTIYLSPYRRTRGKPLTAARELLELIIRGRSACSETLRPESAMGRADLASLCFSV